MLNKILVIIIFLVSFFCGCNIVDDEEQIYITIDTSHNITLDQSIVYTLHNDSQRIRYITCEVLLIFDSSYYLKKIISFSYVLANTATEYYLSFADCSFPTAYSQVNFKINYLVR